MADLITHGAAAILVKAGSGWRHVPVFVAGTLAPDVFSRVPAIITGLVHVHLVALPTQAMTIWQPLHQPVGMTLLAYLLCLFFEVSVRRAVFWNLLGGMAVHLALDLLQGHHGAGYLLALPFSGVSFELDLVGSESTVWFSLPLALLALIVARRRQSQAAG